MLTPGIIDITTQATTNLTGVIKGNGSVLGVATSADLPPNALLDGVVHSDTLIGTVVAGDLIIGNATPKWARLAKASDGNVLTLVSGLPAWAAATGGSHALLDGSVDSDTLAGTVVRGDIIIGNSTPKWSRLGVGAANCFLLADGTDVSWATLNWTTPAYASGNFTASGSMTWTVDSGDVVNYSYVKLGKLIILAVVLDSTTVGGTPGPQLRIAVPGGFTVAKNALAQIGYTSDNGVVKAGLFFAVSGEAFVRCYVDNTLSTNWSAATNATTVRGTIIFEIS